MAKFFYTPDAISPNATWAETDIGDDYTMIRPGSTAGEVYAYAQTGWTETFDFTADDGGFVAYDLVARTPNSDYGAWDSGNGWGESGVTDYEHVCYIAAEIPDTIITYVKLVASAPPGFATRIYLIKDDIEVASISGGGAELELNTNVVADTIVLFIQSNAFAPGVLTAFITDSIISGLGINPFTGLGGSNTIYSTNYGASFAAPRTIGSTTGTYVGFDTAKIGTAVLVGGDGEVYKANAGGAYSVYATCPAGGQASAIWIPRYVPGTANTPNNGTNPAFVVMSNVLSDDDETMWIVTDSGATWTNITPEISTVQGLAVSPDCIAMPWFSGLRLTVVAAFGSDVHLLTSVNGGAAWTDRGVIDPAAGYIRYRRSDPTMQQFYITNGDKLTVSSAHGSNEIDKAIASSAITGVEPF